MQSYVSTETQTTNAPSRASLIILQSPPIRRPLAEVTPIPHEDACLFSWIREDGTISCTRGDCMAVLPSLEAFLSHLHIHLIHEGYVLYLRQCDLNQSVDHTAPDRLQMCEHCRTRFTDDNHKDVHLNSCPKLPAFHEIGSLGREQSGKHNRCVLRDGRPC